MTGSDDLAERLRFEDAWMVGDDESGGLTLSEAEVIQLEVQEICSELRSVWTEIDELLYREKYHNEPFRRTQIERLQSRIRDILGRHS